MLKPPHDRYQRIFLYHLDLPYLPDLDDPDLIGAWLEGDSAILVFHSEKDRLLQEICAAHGCAVVYQADLDYSEWETGHEITPFTAGPLTVAPAWNPDPADIRLDPSVIFGSGFHPTTRLCLEALIAHAYSHLDAKHSALDLGCGTGLLAIAAAKLGFAEIMAVDNNSLACQVTTANTVRNQVDKTVSVRCLDLIRDCPKTEGIDLVMANLHHDVLLELFARQNFWQSRFYILSGFFVSREELLLAALPPRRFRFVERRRREKWALWVLQRTD